jgi:hypothetical protein
VQPQVDDSWLRCGSILVLHASRWRLLQVDGEGGWELSEEGDDGSLRLGMMRRSCGGARQRLHVGSSWLHQKNWRDDGMETVGAAAWGLLKLKGSLGAVQQLDSVSEPQSSSIRTLQAG